MKNPSRLDLRRIWTTGLRGFAASDACTAFRRAVAETSSMLEDGRRLGRRLAERFRGGLDAAAARLGRIEPRRRPSLALVAIDGAAARARRIRAIRRR